MKKKLLYLLGCLFLVGGLHAKDSGYSVASGVQRIVPRREVYAVKGSDTLWFDHYLPQTTSNGISILFVHGGSFTGGDPVNQAPFAEGLTKLGYNVFVVKYRLYLKDRSFGCETMVPEKLKAIRIAVEDTWDATNYLRQHAAVLQVDTTRLFLAGSSAGAETVLNLVFNPFVSKRDSSYQSFRYAGVLSFSGAILDINKIYRQPALPLLLMHGTNDQMVPYGTAAHRFCTASDAGWIMMFGSGTLYDTLQRQQLPVTLYTYVGMGHEVSNFMFRKFKEMDTFMQQVVEGKTETVQHFIDK
ncbi:alpha/beta hydrolase [Chitinophaga sp. 30R24]|uniref:alpha/beta hydrolase n=1 Tax=Chitinophaga sp. 30R24 TaxID=3248838 RepID=UPI003B907036